MRMASLMTEETLNTMECRLRVLVKGGYVMLPFDVDKSGDGRGSSGKRRPHPTAVKSFRRFPARDCVSFTVTGGPESFRKFGPL